MCDDNCTGAGLSAAPDEAKTDAPGYEPDELLRWAVACGIKPRDGWYRLLSIKNDDMLALARQQPGRFLRLRLQSALGAEITREHLAQLLRARLAGAILEAGSVKDLSEAVRVFEKLPDGNGPAGGADLGEEFGEGGLEAAVAEARRLLDGMNDGGAD